MDIIMPTPGTYVVAVSGGVDSVVLLNRLRSEPGLRLIVAHFDHGIRPDSHEDRQFVEAMAHTHGLPFVFERVELGAGASEAAARTARYAFLRKVMRASQAEAILTAHHQDDVLETAVINMLRGTGRRGLTSLQESAELKRPLLNTPKSEIQTYAAEHTLTWREDHTNDDTAYLRNYVRQRIFPRFTSRQRSELLALIISTQETNQDLDTLLVNYMKQQGSSTTLNRSSFILLPHSVSREIMAEWLRTHNVTNYNRQMLERLVVAAKTARAGQKFPVYGGRFMRVDVKNLALE